MTFIDTHTHNYDEAYAGIEDEVVARALDAGVVKLIQADIDSKERPAMLALAERHPLVMPVMLGLYPGSVDKGWMDEIDKLKSCLGSNPVAIGEIGLDYHWSREFENEQKEAFRCQLELAASLGLPVNIHLRDATEDFYSILDGCAHLGLRGCIHAFSGSFETFRRILGYGDWYVGIGGVVTFKNASLQESVKRIPLDRIMLETDSPYLAPTPLRGSRNESANIPLIAAKIAGLKNTSLEEVAEKTTSNAQKLYGI